MSQPSKIRCNNYDQPELIKEWLRAANCLKQDAIPHGSEKEDEIMREKLKSISAEYLKQGVITQIDLNEFVNQCDKGIEENILRYLLSTYLLRHGLGL